MASSSVKTTTISKPLFNFQGRLSEGPTYNPSNNSLLWVDIIAGKIHRVFLPKTKNVEYTTEEHDSITKSHQEYIIANESVGVIYLTQNDDLIYIGTKTGIASFQFSTEIFKLILPFPESDIKLRSNDGNVDPLGNIWQGLMGDFPYGPIDEGKVYKINLEEKTFKVEFPNVLIPNGINWNTKGDTVYWTSSLDHIIYKFKFDKSTGEVSDKSVFINIKDAYTDFESPEPDGHSITEEEHLFTAVWGTNSVAHFDNNGKLVEKFSLPANQVSAASFGGEDLDELFITTANLNLDKPDKLNDVGDDLGGSVFRVKVKGHRGVLRPKLNIK